MKAIEILPSNKLPAISTLFVLGRKIRPRSFFTKDDSEASQPANNVGTPNGESNNYDAPPVVAADAVVIETRTGFQGLGRWEENMSRDSGISKMPIDAWASSVLVMNERERDSVRSTGSCPAMDSILGALKL